MLKRFIIILFGLLLSQSLVHAQEFDPKISLRESPTGIIGVNHIGLSVRDLDRAIAFYQGATGFNLVSRETISGDKTADRLFGQKNIELEVAVLRAPNWLLELTAFKHNATIAAKDMPVIGPGMSHTCYQSPVSDPGYVKFAKQGARVINRAQKPVYSPYYGVSYVYARDPDGNVFELEQLKGAVLEEAGYSGAWQRDGQTMWMSQVSLFTHDRDRLMAFYEKILAIIPNRVAEIPPGAFGDNLFDIENAHVKIGWFRLNHKSKMMEILQFINPKTPQAMALRSPSDLGYSFSLEVSDIQKEYARLKKLGVAFFSKPEKFGHYWQVFARDIDGNIFSLRQVISPDSPYSLTAFDPTR